MSRASRNEFPDAKGIETAITTRKPSGTWEAAMSSPMRRGLKPTQPLGIAYTGFAAMSSPMRRGLKLQRLVEQGFRHVDGRNEFPDAKGIETNREPR